MIRGIPMIIVYLSFTVAGDRKEAFDVWFPALVARALTHRGCVSYDHYEDPLRPGHHALLEAWESPELQAEHTGTPEHAEIVGLGSTVYGMRDLVVRRWADAREYSLTHRAVTTSGRASPVPAPAAGSTALPGRGDRGGPA